MRWRLPTDWLNAPRWFAQQPVYSPLLDTAQLNSLRQQAQSRLASNLDVNLEVHQRLLGDQLSPFVKSGYEFAEIRAYQPGDNVRFINWRRYAQSGKLFINRFHEERRPQCWLIMDRRSTMRFGTRIRLKVTQAAMLAMYHLYKAQVQQIAVGGVIMETQSHWYAAKSSEHGLQALQRHIIAPCPPLTEPGDDTQLDNVLRSLMARALPGCFIFVISDFHDLSTLNASTLAALCADHTVSALHIVDQAEQSLPEHGVLNFLNPRDQHILDIDCDSRGACDLLNQSLQESLRDIKQQLTQHKLHYRQVSAQQNLLAKNAIRHETEID